METFKFISSETIYTFGEIEADSLKHAVQELHDNNHPINSERIYGKMKLKVTPQYTSGDAAYDNEVLP